MFMKNTQPLFRDDRSVCQAIAGGSEEAFGLLLHRYFGKKVQLAQHLLKDPVKAENVVYELFVHLWATKETLAHISNLDEHMRKIFTGKIIDALKEQAAVYLEKSGRI